MYEEANVASKQACEELMKRRKICDAQFCAASTTFVALLIGSKFCKEHGYFIDGCSGKKIHYSERGSLGVTSWLLSAAKESRSTWCTTCAAAEKCSRLHLARLGDRARITDEVVREVSKKHPFVELNWRSLREQLNHRLDLADPRSPTVQKLVSSLRALNLDLADLFPPLLRLSETPDVARELLVQLRLLQSTLQVKLDQFDRGRGRFGNASQSRLRR